jgi:hypothetical protein
MRLTVVHNIYNLDKSDSRTEVEDDVKEVHSHRSRAGASTPF